ncbi:substrate-binding domain-containing protein [Streptomyces tricolor]|nr:substrate-binding domain-containing protein [Streptomyces tricolor]
MLGGEYTGERGHPGPGAAGRCANWTTWPTRAKAIAGSGTPTLAFVLEDITGPSFAHMAQGVEREAARLGHLCLVCSTDGNPKQELGFIRDDARPAGRGGDPGRRRGRPPDTGSARAKIADSLASAGSRLVCAGPAARSRRAGDGHRVRQRGRRPRPGGPCAHPGPPARCCSSAARPTTPRPQGRVRGYLDAHRARGLEPDPGLLHGDFTRDCGHRLMRRALAQRLEFTAVVAATDLVAAGALTALYEAGLDVPGTCRWPGTTTSRSPATSIRPDHGARPLQELGRLAVRSALDRSAGGRGDAPAAGHARGGTGLGGTRGPLTGRGPFANGGLSGGALGDRGPEQRGPARLGLSGGKPCANGGLEQRGPCANGGLSSRVP